MEKLPVLLLLVSIFAALYPFVIYPAILWLQTRGMQNTEPPDAPLPGFTVIIPAHNEERVVEAKLANVLRAAKHSGAPNQIIVAADGCTDQTCSLVRQFDEVELVEVKERGGIVGAFRAGLKKARFEIVVFSDADIIVDDHAYRAMLPHFIDDNVGGVCGETRMEIQEGSGLALERLNVMYRQWIRRHQSLAHSSIGADGANWALRRHLINFPPGQLAEDLVMPLEAIRAGYRFVYEPRAGATEVSPASVRDEYHRKVRTIAGGMQAAVYCRWMFSRRYAKTAFHYMSWKICKYVVPGWMVLGYVAALFIPALRVPAAWIGGSVVALGLAGYAAKVVLPRAPEWLTGTWYAFVGGLTPFAALRMAIRRQAEVRWRMAAR